MILSRISLQQGMPSYSVSSNRYISSIVIFIQDYFYALFIQEHYLMCAYNTGKHTVQIGLLLFYHLPTDETTIIYAKLPRNKHYL